MMRKRNAHQAGVVAFQLANQLKVGLQKPRARLDQTQGADDFLASRAGRAIANHVHAYGYTSLDQGRLKQIEVESGD